MIKSDHQSLKNTLYGITPVRKLLRYASTPPGTQIKHDILYQKGDY
jgi:hypothetical protein